jgi:hypothetical protein
MKDNEFTRDLIPNEDEIRQILAQVSQTQAKQDLRNLPVAILQAWIGQIVIKALNKISNEYDKSIDEFRVEVEETVKRIEDSFDSK